MAGPPMPCEYPPSLCAPPGPHPSSCLSGAGTDSQEGLLSVKFACRAAWPEEEAQCVAGSALARRVVSRRRGMNSARGLSEFVFKEGWDVCVWGGISWEKRK